LHLVVLGEPLAGLVHPCKIYNVMAIGIPVLFVGPVASHVGDISQANPELPITIVSHGDVAAVVRRIEQMTHAIAPHEGMRKAAHAFSVDRLLPQYTAIVEAVNQ
jgi:hypothetical protein